VIRPNEPVRPERRRGLDAAAEQLRHRRLVLLIVWLAVLASMVYTAMSPALADASHMEQTYRACVRDLADVEVGVDFELWVEDGVPYAVAGDTSRVPDDVHATCFGMLTGASG
jgi:hypothetical protein